MTNDPFLDADLRWDNVKDYIDEHGLGMTGRIHSIGFIVRLEGVAGYGRTLLEAVERAVCRIDMPEVEA